MLGFFKNSLTHFSLTARLNCSQFTLILGLSKQKVIDGFVGLWSRGRRVWNLNVYGHVNKFPKSQIKISTCISAIQLLYSSSISLS